MLLVTNCNYMLWQSCVPARRILGLDVGVDIILEESSKESGAGPSSGPPVRQSRRIAQIKIKEEAERRKLEEMTLIELKEQQRRRKRDEKNDFKVCINTFIMFLAVRS